jgi:hypothetical protein
MKLILLTLLILLTQTAVMGQQIIPLWPEGVPNQNASKEEEKIMRTHIVKIENVQTPSLEVYLPSKANQTGKAVVICL